jgi:YggT family protein
VLSWFPVRPGTAMAQINGVLFELTEWILRPLRRIIPPAGMFDLSFMVLFFGLFILRQAVCS